MTVSLSREEMLIEDGGKPDYPWPCSRCRAEPFEPCRTPSGKPTDTHVVRYQKP